MLSLLLKLTVPLQVIAFCKCPCSLCFAFIMIFLFPVEQKRLANMATIIGDIQTHKKDALRLKKEIDDMEPTLRANWSALRYALGRIKFLEHYLEGKHKVSVANKLKRLYKVALLKKGLANSSSSSQPAPKCAKCSSVPLPTSQP